MRSYFEAWTRPPSAARISRSALIRNALREHIRELHIQEMERRDREGYMRFPETPNREWEEVASWPED